MQTVSHEIRTPINGIIGFLEMIQQSFGINESQNFILSSKSRIQVSKNDMVILFFLINFSLIKIMGLLFANNAEK